jgi:hypothetical protein
MTADLATMAARSADRFRWCSVWPLIVFVASSTARGGINGEPHAGGQILLLNLPPYLLG